MAWILYSADSFEGNATGMDELLQPPTIKSIDDLETRRQKFPQRGSI
jgi:hypothetical protein